MLLFPIQVVKKLTSKQKGLQHLFAMTLLTLSVTVILLCCGAHVISSSDCPCTAATPRLQRVWPLSGNDTVDYGQASPFGPRLLNNK